MTLVTIAQTKISRRTFLKMLGASGSCAFLPLGKKQFIFPFPPVPTQVNIPPSLMLHSSDGTPDFLPRLLEYIHHDGFTLTTYQAWYHGLLTNNPVPNPVILTVDDISLARSGCASFSTFVQMKDWIKAAGGTAVFGVITTPVINGQPQREQDEARWDMMQAWIEEGFELATHTAYHSNFNAIDTGPRPDFTAVDYEAEIVESARLIEAKLRERQIEYAVETLIMPYGSGYSYQQPQPEIHVGIIDACRKTNVKFVVGIPQGREPLPREKFADSREIMYVGRIPPAYITEADSQRYPQAEQTASWLRSW
ncbi:MAG: polysaccharide deacetylase family protein [Chloroflexi bacterium]|nr:polysaccharide deacetylase family protein [Chloroflexota bacterium]